MAGLGREEELGELSGGCLKAQFGEFTGIVAAEEIEEVVLVNVKLDAVFLGEAPFAITAAGFPIRDVALRDVDPDLLECSGDVFLRNMIEKHPVDGVAHGLWEARDLAVARLLAAGRSVG